jgi:hypothetical protein
MSRSLVSILLALIIWLSGCSVISPWRPPVMAQPYWGKEQTHFILPPQDPPTYTQIDLELIRYTTWQNNLYPFRSFAFCPLTIHLAEVVGCLYIYDGVKIDSSLTLEAHQVYGVDSTRYVYVFTGMGQADDHSEQFAMVWTRKLDLTCTWLNMARC